MVSAHREALPSTRKSPAKKSDKDSGGDNDDADDGDASAIGLYEGLEVNVKLGADEEDERIEEQELRADLQARWPGQDVDFLEYVVTLAKYKFALGERQRIRQEREVSLERDWVEAV